MNYDKQATNLALAKAMIRKGVTETLVLKALSISEYQYRKLQREVQTATL